MGCIVKETQSNKIRSGFKMHCFPSHRETVLASCEQKLSSQYVSKFAVNIQSLNDVLIPFMHEMSHSKTCDVLIFDEIGRMQNLAPQFMIAVDLIMQARLPLVATIVYGDEIWARKYKEDLQNFFIVVTKNNRDFIPTLINSMLSSADNVLALTASERLGVSELFKKYVAYYQFLELSKLFCHTVKYLANDKVQYNVSTKNYDVFGNHALRNVSMTHGGEYACTCEFHLNHETVRECSHIQAVSILRKYF